MRIDRRARHRHGADPGRFLIPGLLLVLCVVALVVAWTTYQSHGTTAEAAAGIAAVGGPDGVAAPPDGAAALPSRTPSTTPRPSSSASSSAVPGAATPVTSSTAKPGGSTTPSGSPSPSGSAGATPSRPTPTAVPPVSRVVVLNATRRAGAARSLASSLGSRWRVDRTGNWPSRPPTTTVYYPPGQRAAADALAAHIGTTRVKPRYKALPRNVLVVVIG